MKPMMRYPNNDPENGPAYPQVFDGKEWHCAKHEFRDYIDHDPGNGEEFVVTQCYRCGEYPVTCEKCGIQKVGGHLCEECGESV